MTAASAPEEGKKCWLKVTFNERTRMVEWRTNEGNFKELDEKVRKMFGVNERVRLVYTYQEPTSHSDILMSSDEELATALHFIGGEILIVAVVNDKKKRKNAINRAYRTAHPRVQELLTNVRTSIMVIAAFFRDAASQTITCVSSRLCRSQRPPSPPPGSHAPHPPAARPHAHRRPWRLGLCMFFLLLAMFLAGTKFDHKLRNAAHRWHNHHRQTHQQQATILAATYGGKDVTYQTQQFFNRAGLVKASNDVYGDPAHGVHKHLHVVFEISPNGYPEVFSQTIPESPSTVKLRPDKDHCAYPEEAIVDGRSVRVLGALYADVSATCTARRLAATGYFSQPPAHYKHHSSGDSTINRQNFGSTSPFGSFTLVYVKDNVLRTFTGSEGERVQW